MSAENLNDNVGFIGNYFIELFISREYNVLNLPVEDYLTTIKENNIKMVFLDCNIYEEDHDWYQKSFKDLLGLLDLLEIRVIGISYEGEDIAKEMEKYFHIHIDPKLRELIIEKNCIKTPILINEKAINPKKTSSTYDVIYYSTKEINFNEDFKDFHVKKKPKKVTLENNIITRESIFKLIELLKKTKVLFVISSIKNNEKFLEQLEIVAAFYNTVMIYEGNNNPRFSYAIQNEDEVSNYYYLRAMIDNTLYREKYAIKSNRHAFLNNTLLLKPSLNTILDNIDEFSNITIENSKQKISVIISTKRKETLRNLFESIDSQKHVEIQVVLLTHGFKLTQQDMVELKSRSSFDFSVVNVPGDVVFGDCLNMSLDYIKHDYVIKMDDDDFYFPNFIIDLWFGLIYSDSTLVGKFAHFFYLEEENLVGLRRDDFQYRNTPEIKGNTLLCETETFKKYKFGRLSKHVDTDFIQRIIEDKGSVFCIHPYDMCVFRGAEKNKHTYQVSDSRFLRDAKVLYYGEPNDTVRSD